MPEKKTDMARTLREAGKKVEVTDPRDGQKYDGEVLAYNTDGSVLLSVDRWASGHGGGPYKGAQEVPNPIVREKNE